jgi:hypothetical protein
MIVTESYSKIWVEETCRYICSCGHKFTRKNRDWFTMNPFVKESLNIVRERCQEEQRQRERDCPKCGNKLHPQKSNYVFDKLELVAL